MASRLGLGPGRALQRVSRLAPARPRRGPAGARRRRRFRLRSARPATMKRISPCASAGVRTGRQPEQGAHGEPRRARSAAAALRAAASTEKPNSLVPFRSSESALLQAPAAMLAAIPLAPRTCPSTTASGDRDHKALGGRQQRRHRVAAGKEGRRQRLDQHMRRQAQRQPHQRMRGGRAVVRAEGAMLEQQPHDRFGQHDQAERRGQRQPGRKFQRRAIPHAPRRHGRRYAPRASAPAPAPCPWRRRRCRAAARSGGWRNRARTRRRALPRR